VARDDDVRRLAGLRRERQPLLEGVPFLIGRLLYRYAELLTAYGGFALEDIGSHLDGIEPIAVEGRRDSPDADGDLGRAGGGSRRSDRRNGCCAQKC
jgi:hypothetical protein